SFRPRRCRDRPCTSGRSPWLVRDSSAPALSPLPGTAQRLSTDGWAAFPHAWFAESRLPFVVYLARSPGIPDDLYCSHCNSRSKLYQQFSCFTRDECRGRNYSQTKQVTRNGFVIFVIDSLCSCHESVNLTRSGGMGSNSFIFC